MWKYSISMVALVCFALQVNGQVQVDTASQRPPKPPKVKKQAKEFIPTGVMLGIDLFAIGRSIWEEDELSQQEYQAEIDFRHYHLTLGYGITDITRETENEFYSNEGSYWRINAEVNFLYNSEQKSKLFFGVGYARARFDDIFIFDTQDAFGNTQIIDQNNDAQASWLELTTGTKVRVWKELYMGYTVRYKFLKSVKAGSLIPHDLPGFGENRQDDRDVFGFNYYIYWRFPFKKSSIVND